MPTAPLLETMMSGDHGLDVASNDWSAWPVAHAYAGVYATGWAVPRHYPDDAQFQTWMQQLNELPIEGEPFAPESTPEDWRREPHRVNATIRERGFQFTGDLWDAKLLSDELNTLQGVAYIAVCRYDEAQQKVEALREKLAEL